MTDYPNLKPFQKGEGGRKPGSRNKLGEAFIEALHNDFKDHGKAAIELVRVEKPDQYLKVIAAVVPKEVHLKDGAFDNLSDDDIAVLLAFVRGESGQDQDGAGDGAETSH